MRAEDQPLKRQALELLEWALTDMSPDPAKPLYLQCGFEREGHFVPAELPAPGDHHQYSKTLFSCMQRHEEAMMQALENEPALQRIYHDPAGVFLLEAVTKRMGLLQATEAIERISQHMLEAAKSFPFRHTSFSAVPADAIDEIAAMGNEIWENDFAKNIHEHSAGEVFDLPGQGKMLVGRGQHCNLSLWMGGKNLFVPQNDEYELVNHVATCAKDMLPAMFAPCRAGNYARIATKSHFGIHQFSVGNFLEGKTGHVVRYTYDKKGAASVPESYRLEFRPGASDADPYDVALAAAVPVVRACDQCLAKDGNGTFLLDDKGRPSVPDPELFPRGGKPVPKNEAEALALFNTPDNPYFVCLDQLAERKIAHARTKEEQEAAAPLRGIGTRLHMAYCREYGVESAMESRLHYAVVPDEVAALSASAKRE